MFGEVITGMGGLISTGMNLIGQHYQNKFTERMTEKQWARDDSAVQRRVADLQKAGLSPVLAAGQGAGNSPAMRPDMSGLQNASNNMLGAMMSIGQMMNNSAQTRAQVDLLRAQADAVRSTTDATTTHTQWEKEDRQGNVDHLKKTREHDLHMMENAKEFDDIRVGNAKGMHDAVVKLVDSLPFVSEENKNSWVSIINNLILKRLAGM